ncbi:MAG: hypothetical protein JNK53_01265 [Phycisphaerae bacterium]|nr:hypothetical protein [Phycisphaerae bacterium]
MNSLHAIAAALAVASSPAFASGPNSATVTFAAGAEGWSLNGWNTVTATGGNPAHRLHWNNFVDNFGMSARNSTHPAFIGDYTQKGPVTLSIDFQVNFIQFFGTPVPRDLVVILYDDHTFNGAPAAAVWKHVGTLPGGAMPWTTFSAQVTDVASAALPQGWRGAGAEDPNTFEPVLPAGRTWTNVLQGVDRIEFTTYVPGFFYGFTNFNLSIDNATIQPIATPCPEDLTGDGVVNGADLGALLTAWGTTDPAADLTNDQFVDGADLGQLLTAWGACPR